MTVISSHAVVTSQTVVVETVVNCAYPPIMGGLDDQPGQSVVAAAITSRRSPTGNHQVSVHGVNMRPCQASGGSNHGRRHAVWL